MFSRNIMNGPVSETHWSNSINTQALLSILERCGDQSQQSNRTGTISSDQTVTILPPNTPDNTPKGSSRKAHSGAKSDLPLTSTPSWPGESRSPVAPSWLSMSMDAALGCRASIFQIQRTQPTGKRTSIAATTTAVNIHPQASPLVCR